MKGNTYLATSPHHYKELNLNIGPPQQWEDGMRTHGGKGTYEWWYFDAHPEDGSKIVIVFYTKAMTAVGKPLAPYATLNIDYPDGAKIERYIPSPVFKASKHSCDVTIGNCTFKGDLTKYHIHLESHDMQLDIDVTHRSESWRPETGHFYFGDKGNYFAWLVAVPRGHAQINYHVADKTIKTAGTCYHDHNWGNKGIHKLINHWYWSRSELGPYTLIACQIVPNRKYGRQPINIIHMIKDGNTVPTNPDHLEFKKAGTFKGLGGKPIGNQLLFSYRDDDNVFNLQLNRSKNIMELYLIQPESKRKLAKLLTGFNGVYVRITGTAKLDIYTGNEVTESYSNDKSIWELMYFGEVY